MSHRRAAKNDANQIEMVEILRKSGFSVETGHDDVLIGRNDVTQWTELKKSSPFGKKGKILKGFIKDSQYKILRTWKGQYNIIWRIDQVRALYNLTEKKGFFPIGLTPQMFKFHYKEWLTKEELIRLKSLPWW